MVESPAKEALEPQFSPFSIEVTLPSRGRFYGADLPGGKVRVRPMTVAEESLFGGKGNASQVAEKILSRCIESKCIPLKKLLITDKYYLLLTLRSLTYGTDYAHTIKCQCGKEYVHSLKVPDDLRQKMSTPDDVEPFDVELPMCKKTVSLRFLRTEDEEQTEVYLAQLGSVNPDDGDPGYAYRLALHITAVDKKEMALLDRLHLCESMHGRDSQALRRAISEKEPGIDLTINATCPVCRSLTEALLPLTREFFRPNVPKGK